MASMGGFPGQERSSVNRATPWSLHLHIEQLVRDISAAREDDRGDVLEGVTLRLDNMLADLCGVARPHPSPVEYLPEGYARGAR